MWGEDEQQNGANARQSAGRSGMEFVRTMFGRQKKQDVGKLDLWRGRFERNKNTYADERARMDRREALYGGTHNIKGAPGAGKVRSADHVRNIVAELVESQVSSSIPQPKVSATRPEDESLAEIIEDMLRNQLDRLPFEYMNDQEERTVPIQGGDFLLVSWDNTQYTHTTVGELCVEEIHPKKVTPQDGVLSDIEDMDYIFLEVPQTKAYIKRRYGVDVSDQTEENAQARGIDAEQQTAEDMVTQVIAYYRNERGGIGVFSWAGDKVLEDMEDYQARRVYTCAKCGQRGNGRECAYCKSTRFKESVEEEEELIQPIQRSDGTEIPAFTEEPTPVDPYTGLPGAVLQPTRIPYYKPDIYPVILRKNVSIFGKLLGDSDVDKIEDQQETTKKLSTKINEKLFKGGSLMTASKNSVLDLSDEELRVLRLNDPSEAQMIQVLNLQPNISGDLTYRSEVYEEARQIIGITDSYQGRQDKTANSGKAKEVAVAQSAGRLESKRAMKDAAYARLFEAMFKFMLAYSDEPRMVVSKDSQGHTKYSTFNRYDFLEQDAAGKWYWNDRFLFSVDASATLAGNREAMWQETRMNFQQGCYGDPGQMETQILFWSRMEQLHYPGAKDTRSYLEDRLERQQQQAAQQAAIMQAMAGAIPGAVPGAAAPAVPAAPAGAAAGDGGGMPL